MTHISGDHDYVLDISLNSEAPDDLYIGIQDEDGEVTCIGVSARKVRAALDNYFPATIDPRPLTPDAITDEMERRAIRKGIEFGWFLGGDVNVRDVREKTRAILTAALTEPPTRPEGAEAIQAAFDTWSRSEYLHAAIDDEDMQELADHIAKEMNR